MKRSKGDIGTFRRQSFDVWPGDNVGIKRERARTGGTPKKNLREDSAVGKTRSRRRKRRVRDVIVLGITRAVKPRSSLHHRPK